MIEFIISFGLFAIGIIAIVLSILGLWILAMLTKDYYKPLVVVASLIIAVFFVATNIEAATIISTVI